MRKALILLAALAALTACGSGTPTASVDSGTAATVEADSPEPAPAPEPQPEPDLTPGQENALAQAENYISMSGFSYSGLIKQLEFEGFTTADATWAVDTLAVDWNEQAARKAKEYMDMSSFSRDGLIQQLEFEGFTAEQAAAGAAAVGY